LLHSPPLYISEWALPHALLPRLDGFVGREEQTPYDLHLVLSPQLDRHAPLADVTQAVDSARQVYALHGASAHLTQTSPETYHQLGPEVQDVAVAWLRAQIRAQ